MRQVGVVVTVAGRDRVIVAERCRSRGTARAGSARDRTDTSSPARNRDCSLARASWRMMRLVYRPDLVSSTACPREAWMRLVERGFTALISCTSPDSSALTRADSSGMPIELDLIEIGLARLPVVRVARRDGAHAGLELLQSERSCADGGAKVRRAVLHDQEMRIGQDRRQIRVWARESQLHFVRSARFHVSELFDDGFHLRTCRRILVPHAANTPRRPTSALLPSWNCTPLRSLIVQSVRSLV